MNDYVKIFNFKNTKLVKGIQAVCYSENTQSGFRHVAHICAGGRQIGRAKCTYTNRTWESFEYESVLKRAIEGSDCLTGNQMKALNRQLQKYGDRL